MNPRPWTDDEDEVIRDFGKIIEGVKITGRFIAWALDRGRNEVMHRVRMMEGRCGPVGSGARPWTAEDDRVLAQWGKKVGGKRLDRYAIAAKLGRSVESVASMRRAFLELAHAKRAGFMPFFRARHVKGWGDRDIERVWTKTHLSDGTIAVLRRQLGLPNNRGSEIDCERFRKSTKAWLKRIGLKNLHQVRDIARARYVHESGWPEDLTVRQVQILTLLVGGDATQFQLREMLGMKPTTARCAFTSPIVKGHSLLGDLQRRGLVFRRRTGRSGPAIYSINPVACAAVFRPLKEGVPHGETITADAASGPADGGEAVAATSEPDARAADGSGRRLDSRRRREAREGRRPEGSGVCADEARRLRATEAGRHDRTPAA
jgi:hypothetical protein